MGAEYDTPRTSAESVFCCVSVSREAGGKAVETRDQSADSIEWALDPALVMGTHISGLLGRRAKQVKRNLVNNPDQGLVLLLLGSVVSELELKA